MGTELKPCPFHCGAVISPKHHGVYHGGGTNCPLNDVYVVNEMWNRRTPDLTEALARLKALEEEMRQPQTVQRGASAFGIEWTVAPWLAKWAKEIAAIRRAMGARE